MITSLVSYLKNFKKTDLIFDFDETIAKIDIDWTAWHPMMAGIYKKYEPHFEYKNGEMMHDLANKFIKKYGKTLRNEMLIANEGYELKYCKGFIPNQEIVSFLRTTNKYKIHMYSNNSRKLIERGLKELGVLGKFKNIISRESVFLIKPDLNGFRYFNNLDLNKEKFLFVGDSKNDKLAADGVEIDFFKVSYFKINNIGLT